MPSGIPQNTEIYPLNGHFEFSGEVWATDSVNLIDKHDGDCGEEDSKKRPWYPTMKSR